MSGSWPRVALGEILRQVREPEAVRPDGSYPIMGVYGFGRGPFARPPVVGSDISAATLFRVRQDQIVYSRLKAFEGAFGLVTADLEGRYVSNEFPVFRVDEEHATPRFVALSLARPAVWRELADMTTGIGSRRERLKVEAFLEYEIDLPGLEAQRRAVQMIEAADLAHAAARDESSSAFRVLAASIEHLMVSDDDGETLHGTWSRAELGEVSNLQLGFTKGRALRGSISQVPYVRAANVQDGYLRLDDLKATETTSDEVSRLSLETGDVLLLEGGNTDHVGRGWIWEGHATPCIHQNSVIRARPDGGLLLPRFLAYAICASPARSFCLDGAVQTSNMAHLGLARASKIPVPVPPIREQATIVAQLDSVRGFATAALRSAEQLWATRQSLVANLLLHPGGLT